MQALARAAERPVRASPPAPAAAAVSSGAAMRRRMAPRASYSSEGGLDDLKALPRSPLCGRPRLPPPSRQPPPSKTNTRTTGTSPEQAPPPPTPGSRVEPWLSNPLDALAFAPRAALGALLTLPERLAAVPSDLQRAQELLMSDPRPLADKQMIVAAEVESRLVAALEAGARVEQEALGAVKAALPPDAARAVDELLPRPPLNGGGAGASSTYYNPDGWMTSTDEFGTGPSSPSSSSAPPPPSRYEQMYGGAAAAARRAPPAVTYTADAALASRQVAAELAGVKQAVSGLKTALEALREGGSDAGSRAGVLRLNVREARDVLAARLGEVGGGAPLPAGGGDSSVATLAAAAREARMLLTEVDGQFGF
jgi:hypothetical protein